MSVLHRRNSSLLHSFPYICKNCRVEMPFRPGHYHHGIVLCPRLASRRKSLNFITARLRNEFQGQPKTDELPVKVHTDRNMERMNRRGELRLGNPPCCTATRLKFYSGGILYVKNEFSSLSMTGISFRMVHCNSPVWLLLSGSD